MNILLKSMIIVSSLISGLQAMEDTREKESPFNCLLGTLWSLIAPFVGSQAMEVEEKNLFKGHYLPRGNYLPPELEIRVLQDALMNQCFELGHTNNMALVCKEWYDLIKGDLTDIAKKYSFDIPLNKLTDSTTKNLEEYCLFEIFKTLHLTCTEENGEKIELWTPGSVNSLEGEFDLLQCRGACYLTILKGYRNGKKPENPNRFEILIVLRSEIEKELKNGRASHFKNIMGKGYWKGNAPIGVFWTSRRWDNLEGYDYLTTENFISISNDNLYEKWRLSSGSPLPNGVYIKADDIFSTCAKNYHFGFCKPK